MKLIFVNRYFYPDHSATSQILGDLAFHLAREGKHDVMIVTSRQQYDDPDARLAYEECIAGVRIHRVWTTRFGRAMLAGRALDYASFYVAAAFALLRLARRNDVIVAKTDPPLISVVAAIAARLRGAKLVNWVQDAFPEIALALGVRVPFAHTWKKLRNWSMHRAVANVVLGERMAEWARAQRIADDNLAVIPNWANGDEIRPLPEDSNTLRREWGLGDKFVVAYSGNLGRAHEYETALDAAQRLRSERDIIFVFIGGGHLRSALERKAKSRSLDNIRCLPYQPRERLGESLAVADLHWISLLPSLEGLIVPSKVYGVLAAGKPIVMVGDAAGEIGSLIQRHACGVTVAVGAGAEFALQILRLRNDPVVRHSMSHRSRAAFDSRYAASHAFASWERLLANLANRVA